MTYYPDEDIDRICAAANCAPSIFNQHPWKVCPDPKDRTRVQVFAVPKLNLSALLPREVAVSCGAALYNVRLAIQVAGHTPTIWEVPGLTRESLIKSLPAGQTLIAYVEVMPGRSAPPTAGVQELYEAMWLRHTDRSPYAALPVPLALLVEMEHAAAEEHGWLRVLHPRERKLILHEAASAGGWLADAVPEEGDADPARALEQDRAARLRADLRRLKQEVPADRYGPRPAGRGDPPTRRDFWLPGKTARFERHPQLMALSTDDDRPLDWLRAGQALQHALLTGTRYSMSAGGGRSDRYRVSLMYHTSDWHPVRPPLRVPAGYGVTASFLTQSLEYADLHRTPRRWPWRTYYNEVPQMVLRVGFAPVERVPAPPLAGAPVPAGPAGALEMAGTESPQARSA
jgi:hypothetical protein